ncbi:MAG: phosphohydrolase [Clostridia bacterium]|jgi:putative nucleotidyltransferase with HDIG domain|nr:phosphohydrolase [Clostridia bacterium]
MANKLRNLKNVNEKVKNFIKIDLTTKSLIFFGLFLAILSIFVISTAPQRYDINVGDVAIEDIYAPSDLVDKTATEIKIKAAEEAVQAVYNLDRTVQIDIQKKIETFFSILTEIRSIVDVDNNQKLQLMEQQSNIGLNQGDYKALLKADTVELNKLKDKILYITNQLLNENIEEAKLNDRRESIKEFFNNLTDNSELNKLGADLSIIIIRPNMFYDEEATTAQREEARRNVEQVIIKKDSKIITKGQEVTAHQLSLLEAFGLLDNGRSNSTAFRLYAGYSLSIMAGIFILILYCNLFARKQWENNSELFLIGLIIVISLIAAAGAKSISVYLILLPAFSMVISIMIQPKIAIITNIITAVFISMITGLNAEVLVAMLVAGISGALLVHKTHHRGTIVLAGLVVSVMSVMIIISFGLINNYDTRIMLTNAMFAFVGGILSAVLTIGTLPFLEATFDIITPIKLLELSNPNQPLLRRLLIEAPGTYYHSILVGNLAEAAAEEIGANSLLCRIGAYYHDIGKLKRPYFFKENQITKDNPHNKITPNLSTLIITSHVKDGVDLATKNKLPSSVINIIREHHGNTLVAYFYHKAMNSEVAEAVTEDKFRYNFPRPQSKEAAIVMLADSVEAYIRSLTEPTQNQVEQGVRKIIKDKLQDEQLDKTDLTLKDLDLVVKAFVKVLAGIFHDRIEYPETIKDIQAD